MEISIKGDPKEIAALVLAVQERRKRDTREIELAIDGQKISQDMSLYHSWPPMDIRLIDDRGRGGDGNSQPVSYTHLDVYKRQVQCDRGFRSAAEQAAKEL